MAYDEKLAKRIRDCLIGQRGVDERKMFGGVAFMIHGHMCCGVADDELMVRVGPDAYDTALSRAHARPMDFTGRPLKGMVYVAREGVGNKRALQRWVDRGVEFVTSLPPK